MTKERWTFKTLLAFVMQRIDNLESRLDERFQTQQTAMKTAFDAADKAVQAALASAKEAAAKAENAAKDRFAAVNEFRGQLSDVIATFLPRTEYYASHKSLEDQVDSLSDRMAALELRLTSRLDIGQGNAEGGYRSESSRKSSAALTAQWVAIIVVAIGVVVAVLVAVL